MRSATQTYRNVARQTSSPRELEATLLLHAAAQLQSVHDAWDKNKSELGEALMYNRKLWTMFLDAVTQDANPLPTEIRNNVANLGIFVLNRTLELASNPRPEELSALININREVATGLRSKL